ncbi:hypothetical protein [Bradyrhizobium japonicum]|uniref:hypothetical protein n=1 Tax=Bradyrhizobium japonicum TaxID=375 RepID=UPI0004BC5367|nr:hypothetical protein [Bradyrhizobium japonicum]
MTERGWGRRFEDPIRIGDRVLVTLLDAGEYIATLPIRDFCHSISGLEMNTAAETMY